MSKQKFIPFTLSVTDLISMGACAEQVELFKRTFKRKRVHITADVVKRVGKRFDLYWFVDHSLRYSDEYDQFTDEISRVWGECDTECAYKTRYLFYRKDGQPRVRVNYDAIDKIEGPIKGKAYKAESRIIRKWLGSGGMVGTYRVDLR